MGARHSVARPCSAFDRFDEITNFVEEATDLTLPDFVRCDIDVAVGA
jgi:hypothetical protein